MVIYIYGYIYMVILLCSFILKAQYTVQNLSLRNKCVCDNSNYRRNQTPLISLISGPFPCLSVY